MIFTPGRCLTDRKNRPKQLVGEDTDQGNKSLSKFVIRQELAVKEIRHRQIRHQTFKSL